MTPEEYQSARTQIELISSLVQITSLEQMVAFVEFLEKAEQIGVGDEKKWKEVRGDTDLLLFLAKRIIDMKTVLPDPRKKEG